MSLLGSPAGPGRGFVHPLPGLQGPSGRSWVGGWAVALPEARSRPRAPHTCVAAVGRFLSPCRQVPRVLPGALLPGSGVWRGRHRGLGACGAGGDAAPPGLPGASRGHPAPGHRWSQGMGPRGSPPPTRVRGSLGRGASLNLAPAPGNDLGRVLRWGAGYSGEDPLSVLVSVDEADAVLMDRWTILLDAHEAGGAENSVADAEPPRVPVCRGAGVAAVGPPAGDSAYASGNLFSSYHTWRRCRCHSIYGQGSWGTEQRLPGDTPGLAGSERRLYHVPCCLLSGAGGHYVGRHWADAALMMAAPSGWRRGWTRLAEAGSTRRADRGHGRICLVPRLCR